MLNGGGNLKTTVMSFEMKLLTLLGYYPHLDACVVCKNIPDSRSKIFFSYVKSGILCSDCKGEEKTLSPLSHGTVKLLILASKTDIEKAERIDMEDWAAREYVHIIGNFVTYQLGKELKSRRFLEKISR
jgi:DNA repair protein RecO (recombination protein O)